MQKPRVEHSHKPCSTTASRPRCVMRYWTEPVPIGRATTKPPLAKRSRVTRLLNSPTLRPISPAAFSCFKSSRSPRVRTKLHSKTSRHYVTRITRDVRATLQAMVMRLGVVRRRGQEVPHSRPSRAYNAHRVLFRRPPSPSYTPANARLCAAFC